MVRFQILRSGGLGGGLLRLLGASAEKSFVMVTPAALHVRFGFFEQHLPRAEIEGVSFHERELPWYRTGLGWRTNLRGKVALIGAPRNVVRIELNTARRVSLGLGVKVPMQELFISMETPERFVEAANLTGG